MKDHTKIFWFTEQPYGHITQQDLLEYESGRLGFPNTHFDPWKAHELYNEYHEQYAWADEVGFDGIMTNEHHASYWCMKPAANLDAAVIAKLTKRVKIAILGNVIAVNDPVRMAEELAMLDCYSGGRIISGFVRGTAVENIHGGIDPSENWERFQEAHDIIIKCWTTPGPFRYEGKYWHYRAVNPWVLPIQKPHPEIWFPGNASPESVVWAASHGHPYMNMGAKLDVVTELKQIYIDTAKETGYTPEPDNFGYLIKVFCADTDEKAQEIGRTYMWTVEHINKGPEEENNPPGYMTRRARSFYARRPSGTATFGTRRVTYEELQEMSRIIVGSPETVIQKLAATIDRLNPGYIHVFGQDGDMPHKDVMRSIELLGKEVIPALHEIKLQPYE